LGAIFVGATRPWVLYLTYGVLGGAGIGFAYVCPIAASVKWFPDKKGMITGLAVAGFGFGATIWVKLAGSWWGGLLNITHLFKNRFILFGIFCIIFVSSFYLYSGSLLPSTETKDLWFYSGICKVPHS